MHRKVKDTLPKNDISHQSTFKNASGNKLTLQRVLGAEGGINKNVATFKEIEFHILRNVSLIK